MASRKLDAGTLRYVARVCRNAERDMGALAEMLPNNKHYPGRAVAYQHIADIMSDKARAIETKATKGKRK